MLLMHRGPLISLAIIAMVGLVAASMSIIRKESLQLPVHILSLSKESRFVGPLRKGGFYQLLFRLTKGKPKSGKPSMQPAPSASAGEDTEICLSAIDCIINGKNVVFPDASIVDLRDPDLNDAPEVEQQGRFVSFTLHGGKDRGAYQATFRIDPPNLIERRVQVSGQAVSVVLFQPGISTVTIAGEGIPGQSEANAVP